MARNHTVLQAPPERVFEVLSDPRLYGYFVVGSRTIRRFDPRWPEEGAAFHHSLGFGVTMIRDSTVSVECDPPRRLVIRARMRPVAVTMTVFELTPQDGGTLFEIEEWPVGGPAASPVVGPLVDGLLWLRNQEVLRRLRRLVERRERQRPERATTGDDATE